MRMEQANAISMTEILSIIGYVPLKKEGRDYWYYSPLLEDKMSLFHLDTARNTWRDFGTHREGDTLSFICIYLELHGEDHTPTDAKRWLANMIPGGQIYNDFSEDDPTFPNGNFVIDRIGTLKEETYKKYLCNRGIASGLAKRYLKDAVVTNFTTGKQFSALALVNENGGYHLVNRGFKGGVAPKGVSVIRGSVVLPPEVHVFKNFMDFLSTLTSKGKTEFEGDVIILNSLSNLSNAFPYISNYTYERLYSWLDNTPTAQKATEMLGAFCARQAKKIACKAMNQTYAGFRDVSSWHRHNVGLKP